MPLKGDVAAIRDYAKKVGGLKNASKYIATAAAPKIQARANAQIASQTTPYGDPWTPSKSGGAILAGAASEVTVKLTRGGKAIRVAIGFPLGFHNDGTHGGGKKTQRDMRRALRKQGYSKAGIKGALADFNVSRRTAGNVHDPKRPVIPSEEQGIPDGWRTDVLDSARQVMAKAGATEKR